MSKTVRASRSRADATLEDVQTDCEALADVLTAASTRPEVAALVRADLPQILKAMMAGARLPGPIGVAERAAVARMAGLPLDKPAGGDKGAAKDRLAQLAARLEQATGMRARLVEAAREADIGRTSGTADGVAPLDMAESLRFDA